jgi:hypothetical protein
MALGPNVVRTIEATALAAYNEWDIQEKGAYLYVAGLSLPTRLSLGVLTENKHRLATLHHRDRMQSKKFPTGLIHSAFSLFFHRRVYSIA